MSPARSDPGLRRAFVVGLVVLLLVVVGVGALVAALNAGHHRPEGVAEDWLTAVGDTGRDGVRRDALERLDDLGPLAPAAPLLPPDADRDGRHSLFADLEIGRAEVRGDAARVPFRLHARADDGAGEDHRGAVELRRRSGDWRVTGVDLRARSGELVPSEGGDAPGGAGAAVWLLAAGTAAALTAGATIAVRAAGARRGAPGPTYASAPMGRSSVVRRYAPLLALAALQLVIIAAVPSKAPEEVAAGTVDTGTTGGLAPGVVDATGTTTTGSGEAPGTGDPATGTTSGSGTGPVTAGTGDATAGGGTTGSNGTGATATGGTTGATGDVRHCVSGRQFDPALNAYAPPCVARFTGDNGGATYRGVTKDTIKVVALQGNYGALVQAVLEAQGTPTQAQFDQFTQAAAKFVNDRYEMYGRKVVVKAMRLQCTTGGQGVPDDQCLRQEVRRIVQQENPFIVQWVNAVSSATYDELSQLKVLNFGGYGFTDTFNRNHRPYHWDVQMGGNQLAANVADWWCKRMNGQPARYAGTNGPTENMSQRPRNLGVISTNDPENRAIVTILGNELSRRCGARIDHRYFYDQNIQTLQEQRTNAVAELRRAPAATSVMCFCDQVAPQFLFKTFDDQRYYPEVVVVATGVTDLDRVGQTMDHGAEQATQPPERYPVFENAFGLAQFGRDEPFGNDEAGRMWRAAGRSGNPPYTGANEDAAYWAMLGTMVQMAGPNLNPQNVEAAMFRLGRITPGAGTDERRPPRGFGPGDYTWNDGLREVYWSPTRRAPVNGRPGTYVSLNGGRWFVGPSFASAPLALPPKPRA